jgi:phage tail sheath protein FI
LRSDPRGFLFFNAETLSPANDLRPLPVRLLMILLRRLAFREGAAYVFEPHSADFRALVRRRFERMLSLIHQRGGFAGDTPAQSFRVVTDESVNSPGAVDRGRFTVELRVAPARPFRYLNIRLLRTGAERLSVEESA